MPKYKIGDHVEVKTSAFREIIGREAEIIALEDEYGGYTLKFEGVKATGNPSDLTQRDLAGHMISSCNFMLIKPCDCAWKSNETCRACPIAKV